MRVTHGDMKLNNILFCQQTHTPKSIIDLDTCMVGDYLYDYGDFMRIACANCAEDESDLSKVQINQNFVKAACSGFKDGYINALALASWDTLKSAAAEITLTIATRFLTDYLDGDRYFRTKFDSHNLVRARCQLELFKRWIS
jgi:Ser/Thr protein kinase RdoA (MazF antagonist)